MSRFARIGLATCMALGITLGQAHAEADMGPRERAKRCRYESSNGRAGFSLWETKQTIRCAVRHFPTSLKTAMSVADRESGFFCRARNPFSSATGVFQIVDGTWSAWYPRHASFLNPRGWKVRDRPHACRANVLVAVREAHQHGWGAWQ